MTEANTLKVRQEFSIAFHDKDMGEMGELTIKDGKLHFEGKADESAMIMFKSFTDYINQHFEPKEQPND